MRRPSASMALAVPLIIAPLLAAPAAFANTSPSTFVPRVLSLGHVTVDTTVQKAATLTNKASVAVTINGYEVFSDGPRFNGNFTLNPGGCTLLTTLAPGESCTFAVVTSPMVAGPLHGGFCYTVVEATTSVRDCGRIVGAAS